MIVWNGIHLWNPICYVSRVITALCEIEREMESRVKGQEKGAVSLGDV